MVIDVHSLCGWKVLAFQRSDIVVGVCLMQFGVLLVIGIVSLYCMLGGFVFKCGGEFMHRVQSWNLSDPYLEFLPRYRLCGRQIRSVWDNISGQCHLC